MKIQKNPEKLIGLGLMTLALVVYLMTLSHGACPGRSSALIVSHGGFVPRFSPTSPLWTAMVALVRMFSGNNFVFMLNLISALCAALSVGLLYNLMRDGILVFVDELSLSENRRRVVAMLAGSVAALTLAFCIPFWIVANRAHTTAFDVLLLLLAARLLLAYMDYGKLWIALLFSFLFGLGVVEFSTFIVVAPVFGAWLLYVMWKREVLRLSVIVALVGCAVVGLSVYFLAAWNFYKTPGYELMQYAGFFDIIWQMLRSQYQTIAHGLPREGWLIILFVSVVPWLAMFSVVRRGLNDEHDWGLYFLHVIMTAIVIAVLLNTKISPFVIVGQYKLLVTPYLLIAMVYGYLAAYWFLLPRGWGRDPEAALTRFFRNVFGWILVLPLVAVLGYSAFVNFSKASTNHTSFVQNFADEVVESLDGREWLISNGGLDNNFILAANRKGIPLKIISLPSGASTVYLDYLATQFDEPRMKNLAKIGIPALLNEWMKSDPDICNKVAVLSMPDVWTRYGFEAIPNKLLFLGIKDISKLDIDLLVAESNDFYNRYTGMLKRWEDDLLENMVYKFGRRHAGLVANNLGVALEDLERSKDAFSAYKSSRKIDPENISALLNMSSMVAAGRADDVDGSIKSAVYALESGMDKKYQIWSLARYNGYVRLPEAFAQMGMTWARSGQAGMALSELERAEEMLADKNKWQIRQLMSSILMRENRYDESAEIYKDILIDDRGNSEALAGMVSVCIAKKQYSKARKFLKLVAAAGVPQEQISLQLALIEFVDGDANKAEKILDELLLENRKLLRAWVLMADIAFAEKNEQKINKCLRRIESIEGDRGYFGSIIRGRRAIAEKEFVDGVGYYEMALSKQPSNTRVRETLLNLEMTLGHKESVQGHVKALLLENSSHAMALYVRGSLQIADEELSLAEDSLRLSLRSARSMLALNDLAWLVQLKGDYKEANMLIDEALQFSNKQPSLWDTKGVILLGLKHYDEAVEAFGRSLAILDIPPVRLHMGEAQLALGNIDAVKAIIKTVEPMKDSLQPSDRDILVKLQMGIR